VVALTIPGKHPGVAVDATSEMLIFGFDFDGVPVPTSKLHFKELSPGVLEIRSLASVVGNWRFHVRDQADFYGLGEHFDTLNHAHTVVKNISEDNGGPKGSSTYKPMPFFMSTTGYGLWLDATGEATFDQALLNLYEEGLITLHDAAQVASNPHDFKLLVQAKGHDVSLMTL